jgi:hypothetical protein
MIKLDSSNGGIAYIEKTKRPYSYAIVFNKKVSEDIITRYNLYYLPNNKSGNLRFNGHFRLYIK